VQEIFYEVSRGDETIGIPFVPYMPVVSTVGVVVPKDSFLTNDINKAVLETMGLPWALGNSPDLDLHQGPIQFYCTPVNDQFGPWHRGYLTPYMSR